MRDSLLRILGDWLVDWWESRRRAKEARRGLPVIPREPVRVLEVEEGEAWYRWEGEAKGPTEPPPG